MEYNIQAFITKYDNAHIYLNYNIDIVIITGSEKRILRDNKLSVLEQFIKKEISIIGICFGFQYLAFISNGLVKESILHEEYENLKINNKYYLLYYMHNDRIYKLSNNWKIILKKDNYIVSAKTDKWIGFQI